MVGPTLCQHMRIKSPSTIRSVNSEDDVFANFTFVKTLSTSRSVATYLAQRKSDAPANPTGSNAGTAYVFKVLDLEGISPNRAAEAWRIQTSFRHPNILSVERISRRCTRSAYMTGGSLADILDNEGTKHLEAMALPLRHVVKGLCHMHRNNVCHGNLKLENVLLDGSELATAGAVVADFGLNTLLANHHALYSNNHTLSAAKAPELDFGMPYQPPADMYALGVLAFTMIHGYEPRDAQDLNDMAPSAEKDFLSKLLDNDPQRRMTAEQALAHPILKV